MSRESEQVLEDKLVAQLGKLGYSIIEIKNTKELENNLKNQIEKHNKITLSNSEFDRVLNILKKGNVFEKAQTLREKQHIQ